MTTVIREAGSSDGHAIAEIFEYYVINTVATFEVAVPGAEEWTSRISTGHGAGYPFVVAEVAGLVVGFGYASAWRPKPAYRFTVEDTIYVAPGHEGLGLGKALLSDLLDRCTAGGFELAVAVIADTGNPASVALHTSLGFEQVGVLRRVGFKLDRWVDTVLMQRALTSTRSTSR